MKKVCVAALAFFCGLSPCNAEDFGIALDEMDIALVNRGFRPSQVLEIRIIGLLILQNQKCVGSHVTPSSIVEWTRNSATRIDTPFDLLFKASTEYGIEAMGLVEGANLKPWCDRMNAVKTN